MANEKTVKVVLNLTKQDAIELVDSMEADFDPRGRDNEIYAKVHNAVSEAFGFVNRIGKFARDDHE